MSTGGSGHKLEHRRFKEDFCAVRVTKEWHRLSRKVVESPFPSWRHDPRQSALDVLAQPGQLDYVTFESQPFCILPSRVKDYEEVIISVVLLG